MIIQRITRVIATFADAACWILVVLSWSGLVLAEFARFSAAGTVLLAGLLLTVRGVIVRYLSQTSWSQPGDDGFNPGNTGGIGMRQAVSECVLVGAVLGLAATIYLHPGELIFATHDAGVRLNSAAHLASTGAIEMIVPSFSVAARTGTLSFPLGTYFIDGTNGIFDPQFSGVFEMWEALALDATNMPSSLVAGFGEAQVSFLELALVLPAIFALSSIALLFLALRQCFGPLIAWTAVSGIALSYPEIYYARITMAEIVEQLFFVVALYGLVRYWREGKASHAVLAGFGVGLTVLTHLDAVLVYVAVAAWLSLTAARRRWSRGHSAFAVTSTILLVQAGWHYLTYEPFYVRSNVESVINSALGSVVVTALGGILILLWIAILVAARDGRIDRIALANRTRIGLAALLIAYGIVSYFLRPIIQPPSVTLAADGSVESVLNAGVTWVTIGGYIFPTTLVCSLVGVVVAILRLRSRLIWSLLLASGVFAVFLSFNTFVSPHQPFWIRRFLPVVIPALVIFAALGVSSVSRLFRTTRLRVWSGRVLSLATVLSIASVGYPLWRIQPELQGALSQTNQFAHMLPPNSVIIADEGPIATWLPLPLTFLFHRVAFPLVSEKMDDQLLDDAFNSWWNEGKTVVFIADGGSVTLNPVRWGFERIAVQQFDFRQLKPDYWTPPASFQQIQFGAIAYRVVPLSQRLPPTFPFLLRMGSADYGYMIAGFHQVEVADALAYRWTDSNATVDLPRPTTGQWRISLRVGGDRAEGVPPARLELTLDDRSVKTVQFGSKLPGANVRDLFVDVVISGSTPLPGTSRTMRLTLKVNTWRPSDFGLGDVRDLGVAIGEIRVEEVR